MKPAGFFNGAILSLLLWLVMGLAVAASVYLLAAY